MIIYPKIDNRLLKTYPASERQSKVKESFEARPLKPGSSFSDFLQSLAPVLKAHDFKALARAVVSAKEKRKPVIVMLGGHVIKTGCSRILINLAEQGFISHFASNGSAAIHDVELARLGHTSEEVASQIEDGSFGMAHDTAAFVNKAATNAAKTEYGLGQMMGKMLIDEKPPYLERSLLASCARLSIPYTLHVAIGTDIVHQHPTADGGAIGKTSLRDFHILCASVVKLGNGGIVLNLGSAVIMPEVFLKCLAVARNLHPEVHNFTTANFDMLQHYRPTVNIVNRPNSKGGKGFAITGHHEIMLPLFAATVQEYASIR